MSESQESVAELLQEFERDQARVQRLHRWCSIAMVGVVAVVGVSLVSLYSTGKEMYTAEKLTASLEPQAELLRPRLVETVEGVVERVGPHYARLGRERVERVLPRVGSEVEAELTELSGRLAADAAADLNGAVDRVRARRLEALRAKVPNVSEEQLGELLEKWERELRSDAESVVGDFRSKVVEDFDGLTVSIEAFDSGRFEAFDQDELMRHYAHLWLRALGEQVQVGATEERHDG